MDTEAAITKEKLVEMIQSLLDTDSDLSFLLKLKKNDLETLVACVRGGIDRAGG